MQIELLPGIKSISGSTKCKNGTKITFKTYKNGQTRMYMSGPHERATAPSEAELRQRQRFAEVMAAYAALTPDERRRYEVEGHRDQWRFNGKQYKSPAGYIKARIYNSVLENGSRTARERQANESRTARK